MTNPRVVVVGSINADVTFEVHRIPVVGETIVADGVRRSSGGKGANQAYAAARSQSSIPVLMAGAVGDDGTGGVLRDELAAAGVGVDHVRTVEGASGTAMIAVDRAGGNMIVVAPGANSEWPPQLALPFAADDVVAFQLEIPLDAVARLAQAARAAGARVVLNAAPVTAGAAALLPHLDVLLVNEMEARELLQLDTLDDDSLAQAASTHGLALVVTLGEHGSVVVDAGERPVRIPSLPVDAIDTVGAGDSFAGALLAALAGGASLAEAALRGAAAAAATVTVPGARHPGLTPELIDQYLTHHLITKK